jgi:hypothetical protein
MFAPTASINQKRLSMLKSINVWDGTALSAITLRKPYFGKLNGD